jgi:hypothetical protein
MCWRRARIRRNTVLFYPCERGLWLGPSAARIPGPFGALPPGPREGRPCSTPGPLPPVALQVPRRARGQSAAPALYEAVRARVSRGGARHGPAPRRGAGIGALRRAPRLPDAVNIEARRGPGGRLVQRDSRLAWALKSAPRASRASAPSHRVSDRPRGRKRPPERSGDMIPTRLSPCALRLGGCLRSASACPRQLGPARRGLSLSPRPGRGVPSRASGVRRG